jgi:hypothetical protein
MVPLGEARSRTSWPTRARDGPITLTQYERFQHVRETFEKEGINIPLPTGN